MVADLTDPVDRPRVIPEAVEALGGPVEILVNNAAASIQAPLVEVSVKRRNIMFEVNVNAPLDLAAGRRARHGRGRRGLDREPLERQRQPLARARRTELNESSQRIIAYGASKAALNRITNGLAAELYGTGVRVNTVEPRAAVLSEGAAELVGNILRPDQIESMEAMVEGTVFLCDCPADLTGRITVSLDNIEQHGLTVMGLDGEPMA